MRTLSYLVGWKVDSAGRVIVEGEAAKAYPDLTGFRRTAVYLPGEYILLLDDVKADQAREIMWRGAVEKGNFANPDLGQCFIETRSGKRLDFQVLANKDFDGDVDHHYIEGRWGHALINQFRFSAKTDAIRYAVLIDAWKTKPQMTLKEQGSVVTLTVKTASGEDTWTWKPAKDANTPTPLAGVRGGKPLIDLREADKAPRGD